MFIAMMNPNLSVVGKDAEDHGGVASLAVAFDRGQVRLVAVVVQRKHHRFVHLYAGNSWYTIIHLYYKSTTQYCLTAKTRKRVHLKQ